MTNKAQPWEIKKYGRNLWHQRYEAYRLQGPKRSLLSVYLAEREKRLERAGKSGDSGKKPKSVPSSWDVIAKKDRWKQKAQAWDEYMLQQQRERIEARQAELLAAAEEKWVEQVMGKTEIKGRVEQIARTNPKDFLIHEPVRMTRKVGEGETAIEEEYYIESASIDWEKLKEYGHLVKKISFTKFGPAIEFYDKVQALQLLGRNQGLFREQSTKLNVDLSQLTDEQLERIANGEDPAHVLATSSGS